MGQESLTRFDQPKKKKRSGKNKKQLSENRQGGDNVIKAGSNIIKPAGTNTLLVYLLPYFAYSILDALHFFEVDSITYGIIGLIKSLTFALLIVNIGGLLEKAGLKMKL